MDGDMYATECDRAWFAIMPRGRDADCATLEDIDTQDTEVATHHAADATRATTSLLTILRQLARMFESALDISQSLSEQSVIERWIRHIPSLCYAPR
jgi:hypothetical protein